MTYQKPKCNSNSAYCQTPGESDPIEKQSELKEIKEKKHAGPIQKAKKVKTLSITIT
jgi:hypothetical protein